MRTKPESSPLIVSADGEGLVDLAAAGLLDPRRVVIYSATTEHASTLQHLPPDAALAITDTNRRRGQRWAGLTNDYGYTEAPGEQPLVADPLDQRLVLFPDATDATRTVTLLSGLRSLRATTYGTPAFGYNATDRPAAAFDGSVKTAWLVDDGVPWQHERLELDTEHPVTTDHIDFVQPQPHDSVPLRLITKISLRFDNGPPIVRALTAGSRQAVGERIRFPRRRFSHLAIRIEDVRERSGLALTTKSAVGFSEIRIPDDSTGGRSIRVTETTRLPLDLLSTVGTQSDAHPLAIVMSRDATMDALVLRRQFHLPSARTFSLGGTVQISSNAHDDAIDRTLGLPDASHGGITVTSSERLEDPLARASSALDGDLRTAWNTPTIHPRGTSLSVRLAHSISVDRLDLRIVTDGRHSVPLRLVLTDEHGERRTIVLPASTPDRSPNGISAAPVTFPAMHGAHFTVTVDGLRPVSIGETTAPVAIAELVREPVLEARAQPQHAGCEQRERDQRQRDRAQEEGEPIGGIAAAAHGAGPGGLRQEQAQEREGEASGAHHR